MIKVSFYHMQFYPCQAETRCKGVLAEDRDKPDHTISDRIDAKNLQAQVL